MSFFLVMVIAFVLFGSNLISLLRKMKIPSSKKVQVFISYSFENLVNVKLKPENII